jgi:hypothetical protein
MSTPTRDSHSLSARQSLSLPRESIDRDDGNEDIADGVQPSCARDVSASPAPHSPSFLVAANSLVADSGNAKPPNDAAFSRERTEIGLVQVDGAVDSPPRDDSLSKKPAVSASPASPQDFRRAVSASPRRMTA